MKHPVHIAAATGLVRNPDNDILLIRDGRRGWILPGGQVEEGEAVTAALVREIIEETGITASIGPLAAIYTNLSPPCLIIFGFIGRYVAGAPTTSDESLETIWTSPQRAQELITLPHRRAQLGDLLRFSDRPIYCAYQYNEATPYRIIEERTV